MAGLKIERVQYCATRMSVVFEATYSGRTYRCLIPEENLDLKTEDAAVEDFKRRLPDIERIIETKLRVAQIETDTGVRQPNDIVKISI